MSPWVAGLAGLVCGGTFGALVMGLLAGRRVAQADERAFRWRLRALGLGYREPQP